MGGQGPAGGTETVGLPLSVLQIGDVVSWRHWVPACAAALGSLARTAGLPGGVFPGALGCTVLAAT